MTCRECGASLEAGARFCPSCGARVGSPTCRECGADLGPGARFCASCGAPVGATAEPSGQAPSQRERKVATLLFADLVGYTSLNETHDPELIESVVGRAFDRLGAEIQRYEGLVEKFAGDAMLAVFGVPTVHEDDAERAVRAAFELQAAMGELRGQLEAEGRPALALRIGIETGEVLVNQQRATNERDRIVTGDAVNAAARLEQAAAPGQIIVGAGTWAATRDAIEYEDIGPLSVKGKALPIAAWRAVRVKAGRGGGRRTVLGLEAALIGRDEELTLLKETVRRTVAEGRPHLVTVLGSAGVGKSRLTWELEKYIDGLPDNYHWRKGRCLAYAQTSYSALADAIAADASVLDDDGSAAVEQKVAERIAELAGGEAPASLIQAASVLLGISSAGGLTKEDLFEAWREYLELIARRYPLILVLEDIHWADEGLLDAIEFLARWTEAPVMLLCLARHELLERRPTWSGGLPNATTIVLEPLDAEESTALVDGLLGSTLPPALVERVVAVADGNPLFAEELVRLFVDRGVVRYTGGRWQQAQPIEEVEIPQSIQGLLAARLDSLPREEKRLSQDAAVVGRIFWDRLLAHLAGQSPGATVNLLRSLRVKELVVPREPSSLSDAQEYAFRHVLIRDVAYDSIPKLERARKHREVAAWAEERLGDRPDEVVELLAAHYLSALRYEEEFEADETTLRALRRRTMDYAMAAGNRAFEVSQFRSTDEWRRIAVEQARRLQLSPAEFADVVSDYVGFADFAGAYEPRREAAEEAVRRLTEQPSLTVDDRKRAAELLQILAYIAFESTSNPIEETKGLVRRALRLLEGIGPCRERAAVLHRLGWIHWRAGPVSEAEEPLRQALAEARAVGHDELERWSMHDLGIVLTRGESDPEGLALLERSMALAREARDPFLLVRCYINVPSTLLAFDREDEALALTEEGLERGRRTGDVVSIFWTGNNLAELMSERGELDRAMRLHEEAMQAARAQGVRPVAGLHEYAMTLLRAGRIDEARAAWRRLHAVEPVQEPQNVAKVAILDALFAWAEEPSAAIDRLRNGLAEVKAAGHSDPLTVAAWLARMALRAQDADAARVAAVTARAAVTDVSSTHVVARWCELLATEGEGIAGDVATVAEKLIGHKRPIHAADAYHDAAMLASRAGADEDATRWRQLASGLYKSCDAVSVLDALRPGVVARAGDV